MLMVSYSCLQDDEERNILSLGSHRIALVTIRIMHRRVDERRR